MVDEKELSPFRNTVLKEFIKYWYLRIHSSMEEKVKSNANSLLTHKNENNHHLTHSSSFISATAPFLH